jgi:amidase
MADGLPIGMMLIGRHLEDSSVIATSAAFENSANWREL